MLWALIFISGNLKLNPWLSILLIQALRPWTVDGLLWHFLETEYVYCFPSSKISIISIKPSSISNFPKVVSDSSIPVQTARIGHASRNSKIVYKNKTNARWILLFRDKKWDWRYLNHSDKDKVLSSYKRCSSRFCIEIPSSLTLE